MSDVNNIPGNDDTINFDRGPTRRLALNRELENEAVNETVTADQVASVITDYKLELQPNGVMAMPWMSCETKTCFEDHE